MPRPITKTDYIAGLQCPLRLWNRHHAPIPYDERVETPAMRMGTSVGALARELFPGGVLIEAEPWDRAGSVSATKALLGRQETPAIFEAGFEYDGLHARIDVLKRKTSGAFALYEVKSSAQVKDEHLPDLAFQVHVARGSGVPIDEAGIIHINKEYIRGDELDINGLFTIADETARVTELLPQVREQIGSDKAILADGAPNIEPDGHCHSPYSCEFWDRCTAKKPADWIYYLPRLSQAKREALRDRGIDSIGAIPNDFDLGTLQDRVRRVWRTGTPYIDPALGQVLSEVALPLSYLDFETVNPAIPVWPGTRPYQRIPFQWSLHRKKDSGELTHFAFLADGASDPRRPLADALVKELAGSADQVVVYNKSFEGSVLNSLGAHFEDLLHATGGIMNRLWDLLPVVRDHVYYQEFGSSFSIKNVAPVLAPEIDYDSLEGVGEGLEASDAYLRLITSSLGEGETEASLHKALLDYCRLDTLAMVRVHEALERLSLAAITVRDPMDNKSG